MKGFFDTVADKAIAAIQKEIQADTDVSYPGLYTDDHRLLSDTVSSRSLFSLEDWHILSTSPNVSARRLRHSMDEV